MPNLMSQGRDKINQMSIDMTQDQELTSQILKTMIITQGLGLIWSFLNLKIIMIIEINKTRMKEGQEGPLTEDIEGNKTKNSKKMA